MNKKKISVTSIGEYICVFVLLAMVIITFVNVCSRYVFHQSLAASEEITTNLFVLLSLIGAALALKSHSHIGLNLLTDSLKPMMREWFRLLEGVAGTAFFGCLSYQGFLRVMQQYSSGMISAGLAMPMWIYGSWCLLGFLVLLIAFLEIMIGAAIRIARKTPISNEKEKEGEA